MSFMKTTAALAASVFIISTPIFAQAPDQPSGKSDTTTTGGIKKSDTMKSGDIKAGMMNDGAMNNGSADHNGTDTLGGPAAKKTQ